MKNPDGIYTLLIVHEESWWHLYLANCTSRILMAFILSYELVNVNSQGPPIGNPGDSDRVYLTNTWESDSLILTHSGDIW